MFKCNIRQQTKGTDFGEPKFMRKGKMVSIRDFMESEREDTEMYPTLKKYGIDPQVSLADFKKESEIKIPYNVSLDTLVAAGGIEEVWKYATANIKEEFGNNLENFKNNHREKFKEIEQKEPEIKQEPEIKKEPIIKEEKNV
ncbi:MAG: hypothetical protein LBJ73_02820 [Rickettsiales bacterium]|jgi:hypothetical protein|nr:hypothetical protein [Rickettsiales bacterium]